MSTSTGDRLIVFVKAPRLGMVKTRIAKTEGDESALMIYRVLVETVLNHLTSFPHVELRFTPDDAANEIERWRQPGWLLHPQGTGDLGARMERAFAQSFSAGARHVVIIGSDCPHATGNDVQAAFAALSQNDLVLGPATDGGYWLIGLSRPQPSLFTEMTWSTDTVLTATMAHARTAGLRVHLLRELADVDTAEDWHQFQNSK